MPSAAHVNAPSSSSAGASIQNRTALVLRPIVAPAYALIERRPICVTISAAASAQAASSERPTGTISVSAPAERERARNCALHDPVQSQLIAHPPSIGSAAPVIFAAASLQR